MGSGQCGPDPKGHSCRLESMVVQYLEGGGREEGGPPGCIAEGQEVKWNPRTERRREMGPLSVPSHLFTRGNDDVTHFTLGGQWWLEESNRSQGATEWEEREGPSRGLKKLSVLFTMETMFWPLRLKHNNTCRFKFLPSPCSVLALILHQPLSHTSYGWSSKTRISHLLKLPRNYLEKRRRWVGGTY